MAYAYTVTINRDRDSHSRWFEVVISETEATTTSEVEIDLSDFVGMVRLHRQQCTKTSGTGSSVAPVLGRATDPASGDNLIYNGGGTPAASVLNQLGGAPVSFYLSAGAATLYHRSVPDDATADKSITTRYVFEDMD